MRRFSAGRPLNLRRTEDLANQFAEAGHVQKVKELIEPLLETHRNPRFLFNLVLKAFANTGDLPGADAWYLRMLKSRVAVSGRTFGKLLKCAAKAGAAEAAEGWLRRAAAGGFQVSVPQLVSLVEAFARAQDGHRAQAWQQRLAEMAGAPGSHGSHGSHGRTEVAEGASLMAWAHLGDLRKAALSTSQSKTKFGKIQWIAMLDACAKSSNTSKAVECFQLGIDLHLKPCVVTYTPVIDSFARGGKGAEAEQYFLAMLRRGIGLERASSSVLLSAWAKLPELHRIEAWMQRFQMAAVQPDVIVHTNLISACSLLGDVRRAEACLAEMERHTMQLNVVTYTAVLQAHLRSIQHGRPEAFMERLLNFEQPEKRPNALTFGLLIGALASRGDVPAAERWYACMRRNLRDVDLVAHNSVISACAKANDAQRARLWLGRMSTAQLQANGMSLNSTLDALARCAGKVAARSVATEVESLCGELDPKQLATNEITFSILMRPWAQLGDLENVERLWQKMEQQGVKPQASHLWAVLTACAYAQPPLPDTAAQRYQDWVAAGGSTDRHVVSALRAALEGVFC